MGVLFDSLTLELLIIIGSLLYLLVLWAKKRYRYFEERGIPFVKPDFLTGSTLRNILGKEHFAETHIELYKKLKGHKVGGFFTLVTPVLIVKGPDIIEQVLIRDFSNFHDRGFPLDEETNPLEGHLFTLQGEKWRVLRNKIAPTFTSGKLRWMFNQMFECSNLLVETIQNKAALGDVEIKDVLSTFTTDVIGSCAFGFEPISMKGTSEFKTMSKKIFQPSLFYTVLGILRFFMPSLFLKLKIKTVAPEINDFFFSVVKQCFEHRIKTGEKRNDFLQLLLQLKQKGSIEVDSRDQLEVDEENFGQQTEQDPNKDIKLIEFTDEVLTAQAFVFFLAGFETTSTVMSFTLYLLAKNPKAQERVRREIREVKMKYNGDITYDSIKEMTYLNNCMSESMRLYPPLAALFRECLRDTILDDGSPVEKGTIVIIPVIGLHMDPDLFPEPEKFNPDRFLVPPKPGSYLPFGGGPRFCIGKRFAEVNAKLGLAKILDNFTLSLSLQFKEPIKLHPRSFVTQSSDGILLQVKKADI